MKAAEHVVHWMYQRREDGITFNSHGNLTPVLYYDSGYKQKHLYDKPQYGYVVFWGGAPVIWNSKRHQQIPQSVSQAEFEVLRGGERLEVAGAGTPANHRLAQRLQSAGRT